MVYQSILRVIAQWFIIISSICFTYSSNSIHKKRYIASYYSDQFNGKFTTLGDRFSNNGLTIATTEKKFLGKYLILIYQTRKIKVYCNDLMNMRFRHKRHFDLSKRVMRYLSNKKNNYPGNIELEISEVI